jgi:hypothetical protein
MKLSYHFTTSKNCQKQEHNRVFVHCGVHAAGLAGIAATHMMGQREIRDSSRPHMYMCAPGVHQASWTALPTAPTPQYIHTPKTHLLLYCLYSTLPKLLYVHHDVMHLLCTLYIYITYPFLCRVSCHRVMFPNDQKMLYITRKGHLSK